MLCIWLGFALGFGCCFFNFFKKVLLPHLKRRGGLLSSQSVFVQFFYSNQFYKPYTVGGK